ncbi:hypothetical protein [Nocardia sp. CDC160]|uniref:hypothetical protein n=1 Tax=Nocardia sp. CDC160 TaxID=3112166 RepID=UPI002DC03A29|nr:hypothetical protein [Nocardia sp. CDC160]MEC3919883.1 hypothetical protein [Nocardia sp. CDC160]
MTDPNLQSAVNALLGAHRACCRQALDSIDAGGKHATRTHLAQLLDCADITRTAGDFLERQSTWSSALCELAAEACARTADSCDRLDEHACAKACRTASNLAASMADQLAR